MASSVLAVLAPLLALPLVYARSGEAIFGRATCATSIQSCSTASTSANTCCVNTPGGQFLQTQFWDTDPVTGPSNSWTIHGLWPDNCDGTYDEDCDSSRNYDDISSILTTFGKTDVLSFMEDYWQSDSESSEEFWEHEWSTHGTCISTLEPSCYTSYKTGQEAADFFQIVVDLFKTLDTYTILANAGITPSSTKTYTSAAIISAIKAEFGFEPVISCSSSALYQIYYGFYTVGPLTDADFVPGAIVGGSSSNCPTTGVKYLPKSGATATATTTRTATTTKTTTAATSTGTGVVTGKGYLNANYGGAVDGCLISAGTWYTTGTCATLTATASGSGFTLSSSKGNCGVVSGAISCASGVTATVFNTVNGLLAYNGGTTFYSTVVPTGSTQATVYTTSKSYSVTFSWGAV